jgi:hypothetical protein
MDWFSILLHDVSQVVVARTHDLSYLCNGPLMFSVLQCVSIVSYHDASTPTCGIRIRHPRLVPVGLSGRCDHQQHV